MTFLLKMKKILKKQYISNESIIAEQKENGHNVHIRYNLTTPNRTNKEWRGF